jgi:UBX domain-containing protein 1
VVVVEDMVVAAMMMRSGTMLVRGVKTRNHTFPPLSVRLFLFVSVAATPFARPQFLLLIMLSGLCYTFAYCFLPPPVCSPAVFAPPCAANLPTHPTPPTPLAGNGQAVKDPPKTGKEAAAAIMKMKGVSGEGSKAVKEELKITLWKGGYQVNDDWPLKSYDDPEGMAFMTFILQNRVPPSIITKELQAKMQAGDLDVGVYDKRGEDAPAPKPKPFQGQGHQLGGSAAPVVATAVVQDGAAAPAPPLDEGAPSTSVQLKLVDGRKQVVKINLTRTVQDLQRIAAAAHATGGKPFVLKAGVPPKVLDVPCATIEAAGLQGSLITQVLHQ